MKFKRIAHDWFARASNRQYIFVIAIWSLILSALAFYFDPILNRDGMLYVDIARSMQLEAAGLSSDRYGWGFLPLLLSLGGIVGLDPLVAAILFSVICGVLIPVFVFLLLCRYNQNYRGLALAIACLLPCFSEFRADLLRDSGAWLFMLVSLYSAIRWLESHKIAWSALLLGATFLAFLFRIEMALLFLLGVYVPLAIRYHEAPQKGASQKGISLQSYGFALFSFAVLGLMSLAAYVGYEHAQVYVNNFFHGGPFGTYSEFKDALSASANKYLNKDLGVFVFFGFFSLVIFKIISMLGIFTLPACLSLPHRRYRQVLQVDSGLTLFAMGLFFLPVGIFIFMNTFILSRYVMPIVIAMLPLVYVGIIALWSDVHARHGRGVFVAIAVLAALSSVTSVSPGKKYIKDTGRWVAERRNELLPLQIRDARISFYANQGYTINEVFSSEDYSLALGQAYRAVVFTFDVKEGGEQAEIERLMRLTGLSNLRYTTDNGAGKGAVVLSRSVQE